MDKDYLIECIQNEGESSFFDFKKDIYDFKNSAEKKEFLKDILCFSNGHSIGDKYIITGVKLHGNKPRDISGITESKMQDGADYQNLIDGNIEPSLIVDFDLLEYQGIKLGIFKIGKENKDRPYMLKKQYEGLEPGFMKIRVGQRNNNVTRRDLDKMYASKAIKEKSNIVLKGIVNKEISSNFEIKHIKEDLLSNKNFEILEKEIRTLYASIAKVYLDVHKNTFLTKGLIENVEIDEVKKKEIIEFAKTLKIQLTNDFFNLGNLTGNNLGLYYNINGTDGEELKYKAINKLYERILFYKGILALKRKLNQIYYSELLIENIGNHFDDDVQVTLKIDKDYFINFLDFPVPNEDIVDFITEDDYLDRWIKINRHSNVNNYNSGQKYVKPIYPQPHSDGMPGHIIYPDPKRYIDYYHEYIDYLTDYDIVFDNNYYYVKFTIKKINPNEKIFLPSRLFFTDGIESIEYEINSKYNAEIRKGIININRS